MPGAPDRRAIAAISAMATRLVGAPSDFDPLMALVGDARYVLLGEASHGTHDFYRIRAEITKRLIREKGFRAVAVEAYSTLAMAVLTRMLFASRPGVWP